jgi:hypothetical protein
MLAAASMSRFAGADRAGRPHEPVDMALVRQLAAIEEAAGAPVEAAESAVRAVLAECDTALDALPKVEPPAITVAEFQAHLAAVMRRLEPLRGDADHRRAA